MILILLGAPGSGKGTQSNMLKKLPNVIHISTGDILRKEIAQNTTIGNEIKAYIDEGKLIPELLINTIIEQCLESIDLNKNFVILDGYPRSIKQAEFLNSLLNQQIVHVVFLDLDNVKIVQRVMERFICPLCNEIYSKFYAKPKNDGVCNNCGKVDFIIRQDDDTQIITKRIAEFNKETAPLIEFYNDQKILTTISADQNKEHIHNEIISLLKKA